MPAPGLDPARLNEISARMQELQKQLEDYAQAHKGDPMARYAYDLDTKAWRDELTQLSQTRDQMYLDDAMGGVDLGDPQQVNDRIAVLRREEWGDATHAPAKLDYHRKRAGEIALAKLTGVRDGLRDPRPPSGPPVPPPVPDPGDALRSDASSGGASSDSSIDTGHYDDAHAFGWRAPEPPPVADPTGHYDDGHAFSWDRPEPESEPVDMETPPAERPADRGMFIDGMSALASPPASTRNAARKVPAPVIAGGAAVVLVLAAVGLGLGRSSAPETPSTPAPTIVRASVAAVAVAPTAPAAVAACTLVTAAEASTILGRPTTSDAGGSDCGYTPAAPGADFAVPETGPRGEDLTQDIRIARVVIRSATGAQAATGYNAGFALFDASKGDEMVSGIGDKAFYSRGGLYVLQGTKFIAVTTTSQQSAPFGSPVYPPMHAKFLSILQAFANLALSRLN